MKVTATLPGGTVIPLIHIDDWDFNWQGNYRSRLPWRCGRNADRHGGDVRQLRENPKQPTRPPKPVAWGDGTTTRWRSSSSGDRRSRAPRLAAEVTRAARTSP